jgi:hypothetical protein
MFIKRIKNTKKGLITLLLGFFSLCSSAQNSYDINKKYPPEALKQDARLIKDVILQMHPVIGIYHSRAYYEKYFDDAIAGLNDSLTEKAFRLKLKLMFYPLYCGHTEVVPSKGYTKAVKPMAFNFMPYYVLAVNNKLYSVIAVEPKKDSIMTRGTEILKINNISTDSIFNFTRLMMFSDGYINSGRNHFMCTGINYYYPGYFGRPDTFYFEVKKSVRTDVHPGGKEEIKKVSAKAYNTKLLPWLPVGPKEDTTLVKHKRANISNGYSKQNNGIYILKVKSFKGSHFKRVYRQTFRTLRKNKTNDLVLDLRNNGGGSLGNSYELLSYLLNKKESITLRTHIKKYPYRKQANGKLMFRMTRIGLRIMGRKHRNGDTIYYTQKIKPKKFNHYNGKIYLLVNGGSFSASCTLAAYLKESKRAIVIGSETGGTKEGCNAGMTSYYTLPNTKLKVRVPAFRIIHDINPIFTGRGVMPDHPVVYGFEDLIKRRDLEMAKVKELMK